MEKYSPYLLEKIKDKVPASGIYLLVLHLTRDSRLLMGGRGLINFPQGYYLYVGRAKKNLLSRLKHHLVQPTKPHWHIDYFRAKAQLKGIWLTNQTLAEDLPTAECTLAEKLRSYSATHLPQLTKLGSSDCGCPGHFIYWGKNYRKISSFLSRANYLRRIDDELLF